MKRFLRRLSAPSLTVRLTRRMLAIVAASFLLLLVILQVQYLLVRDTPGSYTHPRPDETP